MKVFSLVFSDFWGGDTLSSKSIGMPDEYELMNHNFSFHFIQKCSTAQDMAPLGADHAKLRWAKVLEQSVIMHSKRENAASGGCLTTQQGIEDSLKQSSHFRSSPVHSKAIQMYPRSQRSVQQLPQVILEGGAKKKRMSVILDTNKFLGLFFSHPTLVFEM